MKHYLIGVLLGVAMLALGGALMVLVMLASVRKAHAAEVYIEGGMGPSLMQQTTPDGVWWRRHAVNAKFPKVVMEMEAWHP